MKNNPVLHHYAQQIVPDSLEDVLKMYEKLDCKVVYNPESRFPWAMVGQARLDFAIQIVEVKDKPIENIEIKRRTHVCFLSDDPQKLLGEIKIWAESKNIKFRQGGWSAREFYFDLPDIFVNFVIEIMHTSIAEE